jgi:hypothetical protein
MVTPELFQRRLEEVLPGSTAELLRFLTIAIEQLPVAARKMRDVDHKVGFETIASATEGFELVLACYGILAESFPLARDTLNELKTELVGSLKSIKEAMESKKRFDVADLVEFELTTNLATFETYIFNDS